MKLVGLTGGIGSGKTTIANMFADLGVPVYIADVEAKKLTNSSKAIQKKIKALLGNDAYKNEELDRAYVAELVFNDEKLLTQLNEIIHPAVAEHFKNWAVSQDAIYCIKEAAILFENDGYKQLDFNILVTAPKKTRIKRVLERDDTTEKKVRARMDAQWSDAKKMKLADLVIVNTTLEKTRAQVKKIHEFLIM